MVRKSERNKPKAAVAEKVVVASPRKSGRGTRRNKKSTSDSEPEAEAVTGGIEETREAEREKSESEASSSGSTRKKRLTRKQQLAAAAAAQAEALTPVEETPPLPQTSQQPSKDKEWTEDDGFWSGEPSSNQQPPPPGESMEGKAKDEEGTLWKVQSANGSSGEIQKLKICRQRPADASSESSPSPVKEISSPRRRRTQRGGAESTPSTTTTAAVQEEPSTTSQIAADSEVSSSTAGDQVVEEAVADTTLVVKEEQPSVQEEVKPVEEEKKEEEAEGISEKMETAEVSEAEVSEGKEDKVEEAVAASTPLKEDAKVSEEVEETKTEEVKEEPVQSEEVSPTEEAQQLPSLDDDPSNISEVVDYEPPDQVSGSSPEKEIADSTSRKSRSDEEDSSSSSSSSSESSSDRGGGRSRKRRRHRLGRSRSEDKIEAPREEVKEEEEKTKPQQKEEEEVKEGIKVEEKKETKIGENKEIKVVEKKDDEDIKVEKEVEKVASPPSAPSQEIERPVEQEKKKDEVKGDTDKSEGEVIKKKVGTKEGDEEEDEKGRRRDVKRSSERIPTATPERKEEKEEGELSPTPKPLRRTTIIINKPQEQPTKPTILKRTIEDGQSQPRKRRTTTANRVPKPNKEVSCAISSQSLKLIVPDAKPVPLEEVDLSLEEEKKTEKKKTEKKKIVITPEKEIGGVEVRLKNDVREVTKKEPPPKLERKPIKEPQTEKESQPKEPQENHKGTVVRKISIVSEDAKKLTRSPSPPGRKPTAVLFITNLVRPFTVPQLRELLARTGSIAPNGFYIDKIKSKCYVKYTEVEMAVETRHALHGVRWPVNNPKTLKVEFATPEDMEVVQQLAEEDVKKPEASSVDSGWLNEQAALKPARRVTAGVREWDVGKVTLSGEGGGGAGREGVTEKGASKKEEWRSGKENKVGGGGPPQQHDSQPTDTKRRAHTPDHKEFPPRKVKRRDNDAPSKLLDDLFRKTKATPCIYWLPLNAAQIVVKEEMRRQHMAEHERRLAELRKTEQSRRERDRERRKK